MENCGEERLLFTLHSAVIFVMMLIRTHTKGPVSSRAVKWLQPDLDEPFSVISIVQEQKKKEKWKKETQQQHPVSPVSR